MGFNYPNNKFTYQPKTMTDQPITNIPQNDKYINLYLLVSSCGGNPTKEILDAIITLVHKDFPENKNNY